MVANGFNWGYRRSAEPPVDTLIEIGAVEPELVSMAESVTVQLPDRSPKLSQVPSRFSLGKDDFDRQILSRLAGISLNVLPVAIRVIAAFA